MFNHRTALAPVALALALTAFGAAAQPGPHGRFDPAQMQERIAKRQAELKQKLAITPAQEAAWASFTAAMKPPANVVRPDREALARMSTPDRIDQLKALRNQRIAEQDRRGEATKAFYAVLSAEQKKVFDEETARMHRHHGERMKMMMRPG